MKLNDLMTDLNQLTKLLSDRYNTEVSGKLSVNPENLSEILLTLAVNTATKPVVEKTAAPDAAQVVDTTATEVASESQS